MRLAPPTPVRRGSWGGGGGGAVRPGWGEARQGISFLPWGPQPACLCPGEGLGPERRGGEPDARGGGPEVQGEGAAQLGGRGRGCKVAQGTLSAAARMVQAPGSGLSDPGPERDSKEGLGQGLERGWACSGSLVWRRRVCAWPDARGPQLGLWALLRVVTGGSRWAAGPGSCPDIRRAGQVSPPPPPWGTKTRPCRRGLGAQEGTRAAAEGRGCPGNLLESEPQSLHPRTLQGLPLSWGLGPALSSGWGAPGRHAHVRGPWGGTGQPALPLPPTALLGRNRLTAAGPVARGHRLPRRSQETTNCVV